MLQVIFKTLNPHWNQTLEFPDDGSPLLLHVKDHNALLPTSSIGDCVVEYQRLPPNQMADKWIPLQGVKRGEIHIQITRKVPDLEKDKRCSLDSESSFTKAHQVSSQVMNHPFFHHYFHAVLKTEPGLDFSYECDFDFPCSLDEANNQQVSDFDRGC